MLDKTNINILNHLQQDASISVEALADKVSLSRNACWRRVKALEDAGIIRARVAVLDAEKLGVPLSALVMIRTNQHESQWLELFRSTVLKMPEITAAWRMSGDLDYVLRVRIASVASYDSFYKKLIEQVPLSDVSASFVLEEIKETTELPVGLLGSH